MALYIDCVLPKHIGQLYTRSNWRKILQYLLVRATITCQSKVSETAFWCHLLDIPAMEKVPIAALTGLTDRLDVAKYYWLRADPQKLVVKSAQFFAEPFALHEVNTDKMAIIFHTLQALFSTYSITLHTPCADRWYLSMPFDPILDTQNIAALQQGIPVVKWIKENCDSQSSAYVPWKKLFTEVQMVLHQAKLPFNALWFWGGGFLPEKSVLKTSHSLSPLTKKVWSNIPLIEGLASLKNNFVAQHPKHWKEAIAALPSDQQCCFIFKDLSNKEMLNFFQEIVDMLQTGHIKKLRLYDEQGNMYASTPYTIRRFWRYTIPTVLRT